MPFSIVLSTNSYYENNINARRKKFQFKYKNFKNFKPKSGLLQNNTDYQERVKPEQTLS
jgi:hypothetical protein